MEGNRAVRLPGPPAARPASQADLWVAHRFGDHRMVAVGPPCYPARPEMVRLAQFFGDVTAALVRARTLDRAGVERWQAHRWRSLARHAQQNVPFYRRHLQGVDVDAARLQDLPTVSKAQLMQNLGDSLAEGVLRPEDLVAFARARDRVGQELQGAAGGRFILSTTSGTSGLVGYFVTERRSWERQRAYLLARLMRDDMGKPTKVLRYGPWNRFRMGFVTATGGHYMTYLISLHSPPGAMALWQPRAFSILTPMGALCEQLNAFRPHFLHGYPTFMEALSHEQMGGTLRISPAYLSLSSEPFTLSARSALTAAFPQSQQLETYGTTECIIIASPCAHGRLHINEDVCVVESVDGNNQPMPEGKLGAKVLLTNLWARTQPLLRYEIPDQVVLGSDPCPCGSAFRTLRVMGRTDDTFYLRGQDGLFHAHTPIPFETLFLEVEGLKQYQLVHEAQNVMHIHYMRDPRSDGPVVLERLRDVFGRYLQSHGLAQLVTLHITETDEIPRDPNTHKLRQIVSRVAVPEADELSGPWRVGRPVRRADVGGGG
jgi:phenylacetate-CoA ligase